jgi:hypothetical protein
MQKATHVMQDAQKRVQDVEKKVEHVIMGDSKKEQPASTSTSPSMAQQFGGPQQFSGPSSGLQQFSGPSGGLQQFSGPRNPAMYMETRPEDAVKAAPKAAPSLLSKAQEAAEKVKDAALAAEQKVAADLKDKIGQLEAGVQHRVVAHTVPTASSSSANAKAKPRPEQDLLLAQSTGSAAAPWPSAGHSEPGRSLGAMNASQAEHVPPLQELSSSRARDGPPGTGSANFVCSLTSFGNAFSRLNLCQPHLAPPEQEMRFEPPPPLQ